MRPERARKGQEKLLALIEEDPYISVSAIADQCEMSVKSVRNLIDGLRDDNILVRVRPNNGGYWKVVE